MKELLGIDLAGSEKRRTGIAYFEGDRIVTKSVYSDEEILEIALKERFKVVGIDAPLSLPKGRRDIEERNKAHFRECDLKLRERGIRFFPITLGGMRKLTERGIKLKELLEREGKRVIEIFPGASLDVLGIKRKSIEGVRGFVKKLGFRENIENIDESDAVVGLLTLYFDKLGFGERLSGEDGEILILNESVKNSFVLNNKIHED